MEEIKLNTIDEAVEQLRRGEFVIVVDDEDRENEGDFIIAAEKITEEKVNFMLREGRGVLCAPITAERCHELELNMQVDDNTSMLGTPFTVTIDLLDGCTTGVSMQSASESATLGVVWMASTRKTPRRISSPGEISCRSASTLCSFNLFLINPRVSRVL